MKSFYFAMLLMVGLLGSGLAHADCPPGSYLVSNPTNTYCLPDPNYRAPQQAPQPPAEQWERRWGAIATDGAKGAMGVATDKRSKREASQVAMQDCQSKGGTKCKIDAAYDNQCAVVIMGSKTYNTPNAITVEKATELGMKTCRNEGNPDCHVYYSACSLPVRVQ